MKELERILKAAADETRLRIIKLLQAADELCVCEILQALDMNQATVSKALSVLKNAGIVDVKRKGLWKYYSLMPRDKGGSFPELSRMLKNRINNDPLIKKDRARLKSAVRQNAKKGCNPGGSNG